MKKVVICLLLVFVISLSGCFTYHYIEVEPGSNWSSTDPSLDIVIVNGGFAEGTLGLDSESIEIEIYFGPGRNDYAVYIKGDDSLDDLFYGNYRYNKEERTITFEIVEEQIGLNTNKIVLYKE